MMVDGAVPVVQGTPQRTKIQLLNISLLVNQALMKT